ncbi:hypothetical protein LLG95_03405, partial [bacterium]|nr:hypothetical protein [bacterium]
MMKRQRIQEVISLYALLILAVCWLTGCGSYTDPPKEFKDSYIITEVSGMGELGTIDEFQKGLAMLKMDNGKTPGIHGWKKNDNVYQLCFSMKDQDCVAQFTFILGGTGVDQKKIGKACTLDYVIAGEGRSEGVGASSVILLAINALQESGVETSIQKHEKQKKAELEEFMKKKDEQEKVEKRKNEEEARVQHERDEYIYGALSGKIPAKFTRDLDELCKTGKIATKSDVDVYLKNNAAKIAESRLIEKFITEEFSFDS